MTAFEQLPADWISCAEALDRILKGAHPTPGVRIPLERAAGRSLAAPVVARATLPSWPNSAMDGFAVRSAELDPWTESGVRLPVAARALPGELPLQEIAAGHAVRIMTGGPVPEGFDSVIRVEHTDGGTEAGFVQILRRDDVGKHIRAPGRDMWQGDETVPAGRVVHSGTIPVIAASGADAVTVFRRPRVGVLSSGDELAEPDRFDEVVAGRAVPDTNSAMIVAAVAEAGGVGVELGVAPDSPGGLRRMLADVRGVDLLISTGGASMGERDLLKRILLEIPFRLDFWRVRMRPGSPVSFGCLEQDGGALPVFGLPGNPASAFVTFHVLVAPFLRAMLGSERPRGTMVTALAGTPLPSTPRLTHFLQVRLLPPDDPEALPRCEPSGPQGSGLVRAMRDADALAIIPEGEAGIAAGDPVQLLLLPGRS